MELTRVISFAVTLQHITDSSGQPQPNRNRAKIGRGESVFESKSFNRNVFQTYAYQHIFLSIFQVDSVVALPTLAPESHGSVFRPDHHVYWRLRLANY